MHVASSLLPPPSQPMMQRRPRWWERYSPAASANPAERTLKRFIWLYWLLWLVEGALRKWVAPQFAGPLLLVRDPVALAIIVYALAKGIWRLNGWTIILYLIGLSAFVVTMILGIPLSVGLVGLRTICLHLPLIFILPRVLSREDVDRIGNLLIDLSLPMALLMVFQFSSSPDSFINAGAGLNTGQIEGVDGRIRAPGVFSYISGAAQFYGLVAAFLLNRYAMQDRRNNLFLIFTALGIVLAISMSISRTLVSEIGLVVVSFIVFAVRAGLPWRKLALFVLTGLSIASFVTFSQLVREGNRAMLLRWTLAEESEGSAVSRALGEFWLSGDVLKEAGLFGKGIGVGTNMGAFLLGQEGVFLLAEKEWERVVLEMGIVLGVSLILWRIALFFKLVKSVMSAWARRDLLPGLLLGASAYAVLAGQSGQPATLGFIVLAAGVTLAADEAQLRYRIQQGILVQQSSRNVAHRRTGQFHSTGAFRQ